MKKMFLATLYTIVCMFSNAQSKEKFNYLTGNEKMPGYAVTTKTCCSNDYSIKKEDGAPILQVYVQDKSLFVGGEIENVKGEKTKITDLTLEKMEKYSVFTVKGKKFSISLNTQSGYILKEEKDYTIFYSDGIGIWKIYKNKIKN